MNFLKDKIRFGTDPRKRLNGSDLYVKTFQLASILPVFYLFMASGYMGIFSKRTVFSVLFDLGISVLPRAEALALSYIYRITDNELIMVFIMMIIGLILGLLSNKIFREDEKRGIAARKVFIVLIAIDLVVRLLPMKFNPAFGLPMAAIGFIIRAGSIALLYMDIKAANNNEVKL
ncbi:MAG: hypothetical protein IKI86_04530 [Firmicutes bacterium]|nr:hypothetical protein [Bacillota bacterium]